MAEDTCCELIELGDWGGKTVSWDNKPFIRKKYSSFFYIPLGLDKVIGGLMKELNEKELIPEEHPIMLFRKEGLFGGELLVAVKSEVPGYETVKLSGKYYAKAYEGKSYSDAGKWHKDFKQSGKGANEVMTEYVLCPGCQKKFGKMQAILFGKLS